MKIELAIRSCPAAGLVAAGCLALVSGCDGDDGAANAEEIEISQRGAAEYRERYNREAERVEEIKKENATLASENRDAKRAIKRLESKLRDVERDLAHFIEKEENARAKKVSSPSQIEMVQRAKESVSKALPAVVTIAGDNESGRGVIVKADGKVWIYTLASLVSANRKLQVKSANGSAITAFGVFEVAVDGNLARLELPAGSEAALVPAETAELSSRTPLLGVVKSTPVEGGGYNWVPATVALSRTLEKMEQGAPVFNGESGELIGLAGRAFRAGRANWKSARLISRSGSTANRIDRPVPFKAIPIGMFLEEARIIEASDELARVSEVFLNLTPGIDSMNLDVRLATGGTVREFIAANPTNPSAQAVVELEKWLRERGARASEADRVRRISAPYEDIRNKLRASSRVLESRSFSGFHASVAKETRTWIDDAELQLGEFVTSLNPD